MRLATLTQHPRGFCGVLRLCCGWFRRFGRLASLDVREVGGQFFVGLVLGVVAEDDCVAKGSET